MLHLSNRKKSIKNKYLDWDEIEELENPGEDYHGDEVTIIGKPFSDEQDPNYKETKKYIKDNNLVIWSDFEDIKYLIDEDIKFIYANHNKDNNLIINCYIYGPDGVRAFREY